MKGISLMRNSQRAAAVAALAVSFLVPVVSTANATEPNHGTVTSTAANEKPKLHKPEHPKAERHKTERHKAEHRKLVRAGTVTAVSATSITITVHGGRDNRLRDKPLIVVVTPTTKVTRNYAVATIASVKVGDHANIKGTKTADVYTATRVSASGL
jgi:hypothetical protein